MGRPKYFTPNEVSIHNTAKDIWVSFLGKVYNLTPFIEENAGMRDFFLDFLRIKKIETYF